MVTRDTPWEPGTPCWVELMTSDIAAARLFYEGVFEWQLQDTGPDTGGYLIATVNGRQLGGLGGPMGDEPHPPVWNTYLATDDINAAATAIKNAGGTLMMEPMDVMDVGKMLVAMDPSGAVVSVWQAGTNTGMQIANEANTPTWNELWTRDFAKAKDFYAAAFGYTYDDMSNGDFQYVVGKVGDRGICGIMGMPAEIPDSVPSHWRVYFEVDDPDESVDMVVKLDGTVTSPPTDTPYGRMAHVIDPQGASFSVIHGANPQE
ncbi:MAG TPA: VOC family protein [Jatrophihabitantaceae bacterium]|nr:VOC family protein [Jatrophihabitantaceae bacterium]